MVHNTFIAYDSTQMSSEKTPKLLETERIITRIVWHIMHLTVIAVDYGKYVDVSIFFRRKRIIQNHKYDFRESENKFIIIIIILIIKK